MCLSEWLELEVKFPKLSKASDNKMSNLLIVWITRNQEHVSGDSLDQHPIACDAWLAESYEYPGNVRGNNLVCCVALIATEGIKQVKHPFLNYDVEWSFIESKMD